MADKLEIGGFNIKSCIISNWAGTKESDIKLVLATLRISEGINKQAISGSILLYDAVNFMEEFPVRGEEKITITYEDYFGVEQVTKFQVYSVEKMEGDAKGQGIGYYLRMHSIDFMKSESKVIRRSLRGRVSSSAKQIFDEHIESEKECEVEDSDNQFTIVIPALSAFSAINLFMKKCYSETNPSSSFVFFESREKYYMMTLEKLIRDKTNEFINGAQENKIFSYAETDVEIAQRAGFMNNIISFNIGQRTNTIEELRKGGMIARNVKLKLTEKQHDYTTYRHFEESNTYQHLEPQPRPYHSQEFVAGFLEEEENPTTTYVMLDDEGDGGERHYVEINAPRSAYRYFMESVVLNAKIYGRNDIFAGDVLYLRIPPFKTQEFDDSEHPALSGFYLVESIDHIFDRRDGKWIMELRLLKDALKNGAYDFSPTSNLPVPIEV